VVGTGIFGEGGALFGEFSCISLLPYIWEPNKASEGCILPNFLLLYFCFVFLLVLNNFDALS